MLDKKKSIPNLSQLSSVDLELGCGNHKRHPNAIGIDSLDYPDVDIVGDIYLVLAEFPSESVNSVCSYHFIEHVSDVPKLLAELERIVKPNGRVEFVAPHFSNPYFYSDPTHRNFFGLYTFCYFTDESKFSRKTPTYGYKSKFRLAKVDLVFKSSKPFFGRYIIKYAIGLFFNSCNYLRELYEENFCYIFPCYEVRYVLQRNVNLA